MRRIVVIAAGMPGTACAARIKHHLPDCELNVILPVLPEAEAPCEGPAGKRCAAEAPDPEFLSSREIAILEAQDITPDFAQKEVTLTSTRGRLAIRYTDIVIEVPATVRLPRALQQAENIFRWPAPGLSADPAGLDAALLAAREQDGIAVVAGNGPAALDAVFLAREAGVKTRWLRTGETGAPGIEPHLLAVILKELGPDVVCEHLPGVMPEQLVFRLDSSGTRLESICAPGGEALRPSLCLWTSPLMARHPVLREDGVILDAFGRIETSEGAASALGLHLMGSGAAVSPACIAGGAIDAPIYSGGEESARLSAARVIAELLHHENARSVSFQGALGARSIRTQGLCLCLAGYTSAEAQRRGLDAEQAIVSSNAHESGRPQVILSLVCDRKSRALLGVQALGLGEGEPLTEGLFGMGLAALSDSTSLDTLMQREWSGLPGRLFGNAAFILGNKLDTVIQGISPDEFLASRAAGAEFFTLDLRSTTEWDRGHLPDACNIPLPQLKKRLQDEVPRFTPLVLVCATANEAHAVAVRLADLGATDLYVLDGGMSLWPYELS